MKNFKKISLSLMCVLYMGYALAQSSKPASLPELQTFSNEKAILDLRNSPWQYIHDTTNNVTFIEVLARKDWSSIEVGRSWDKIGRSELRKGTVWVRTNISVPFDFKDNTISFFCTAVGDYAEVFINGKQAGERMRYDWWVDCPGPSIIDINHLINFGNKNEIIIKCGTERPNRSIGLLGLVCLRRSVPHYRNSQNGIVIINPEENEYNVVLHYGNAILSAGEKTSFSPKELAGLNLPVFALREDEMINVIPVGQTDVRDLIKIDMLSFHKTNDKRPVSIRCTSLPNAVNQYELLTLPVELTASYNNPFDPEEIKVKADVLTPSGKIETVSGFFAQDYKTVSLGMNEEILIPVPGLGTPWRINYRPRDKGKYIVYLNVSDNTGEATYHAGEFTVSTSEERGFLRVSKKDNRYFEFDNGDIFYATGPSGWFRQSENWMMGGNTRWIPVEQIKEYYKRKGSNHSTYEYLARWHFGQLYLKDGFIDSYVAWKLNEAIRSMESNGIYWITYGRPASGRTYYNNFQWGLNKMSLQSHIVRQNGLPTITELGFERGGRIELFHFVSRWADSPAIWMWNCAEEDGSFNPEVIPYHSYIRDMDIYNHPHGVSEGVEGIRHGGDAIILPDWYNGSYEKCLTTYEPLKNYQVPVIDIEGSVNSAFDLYNMKEENLRLIEDGYHNHLWLCLFMKMAGGGTDWFNVELDANNMLFHAKAIHRFLIGENLVGMKMANPIVSETDLDAFSLTSNGRSLAWMILPPSIRLKTIKTFFANIPVETDGQYIIELWDTRKGEVIKNVTAHSINGIINVQISDLKTDIALKAILQ
jgi:hypothetical protein